MSSYDHNGLELTRSKNDNTSTAYFRTSWNPISKKFQANFYKAYRGRSVNGTDVIREYEDARDAAFVAQEFDRMYTPEQNRLAETDGTIRQITADFVANLVIPTWQYPAEGFDREELINGSFGGYRTNYDSDAREALKEALRVFGKKPPTVDAAREYIKQVEVFHAKGMTYRQAAAQVIGGI